jgi:NOL1/NOP2/sun family putative RNA methylase
LLKDAWTLAIETLSWMEMQKLSEHLALARTIKQLDAKDPHAIRYAYGLVVETTRRKNLIDKFVDTTVAPKQIGEFNLGIQSFLRLYVYQTRAAKGWQKISLDEAKSIAGLGRSILGWDEMREIEGVLGFLLSRKIEPIFEAASEEERLSLDTYHPLWFVQYCINLFGRTEAEAFLKGSMKSPPTYIRVNTLKDTEEEILNKLQTENVKLEKIEPLQNTYQVFESKQPINSLPSYQQGLIYIQDKASCYAAQVANPLPGSKVFDVCAAPGAKTTYLAQLMDNEGTIVSVDFSARRLVSWKKEVARMGVTNAMPIMANATFHLPLEGEADLIVLDPPCTSTGIFAKQPSAKWRLSPKSLEKMSMLQWHMINSCAEKVKAGGTLTYSTCSITVEENEAIIERFVAEHKEFSLVDIEPKIGVPALKGLTQCQRLYPHLHGCNGFFIAKMQKTQP